MASLKRPLLVPLLRSADFLSLKSEGKTLHVNPWLLVNYRSTESEQIRYGWTISRYVGNAVLRNRLRRWGREFIRQNYARLGGGLDLNLVFKKREAAFYSKMSHEEFDEAMDRMVGKLVSARH